MPILARTLPASLAVIAALAFAAAVGPGHAPIMPLASRSLLLDIAEAGNRLVVAGERGHILYSDDDGEHWQQALVPTTQMLTGVHFVDAERGWAAGHDGLVLASEDGGATWRIQRDGLAVQHQRNLQMREAALDTIESLENALAQQEDDEALLALEDARFDLEDANLALSEPVFTSPLMDIWFEDTKSGWAVGAFGEMVTTRDGGGHWSDAAHLLDNPDEFHLNTITGDGAGRIFIAGEGGVMYRSLDGGDSFEALPPIYEGSWFGTLYHARTDALLVFGLRGNLFRSTDFGTTWTRIEHDRTVSLAGGSSSKGGDIVLGGAVGTYLISIDGGREFSAAALPDRLSLSTGIRRKGRLVLLGQGGARLLDAGG